MCSQNLGYMQVLMYVHCRAAYVLRMSSCVCTHAELFNYVRAHSVFWPSLPLLAL